MVKELKVVEEGVLWIVGDGRLEKHEVGEGREILAQGVGFHAPFFDSAESEVEILVPDAAAEFAGGYERKAKP